VTRPRAQRLGRTLCRQRTRLIDGADLADQIDYDHDYDNDNDNERSAFDLDKRNPLA
jgi:hypothetical protein